MTNLIKAFLVLAAAALIASPAMGEIDKKTEKTWKSKCAACHGVDGKGETDQGKKLKVKDYTTAEWQGSRTDAHLRAAIENGVPDMDGYKGKIDDEQIGKLVEFVRSLKK